jgi:hypothetical protein
VSRDNLATFLYEAFEIKVDGRSLGRALESDAVRGKVLKVKRAGYQILPPGMDYAREMAGLAGAPTSTLAAAVSGATAAQP